jgi:hypothetical protein
MPVAAFTAAARVAGEPLGRRSGRRRLERDSAAARVWARPITREGGDANGREEWVRCQ